MKFDREKIAELRKELGMNTTQFAVALGTSRQRVENWEKLQCYPNIESVLKMCAVFGKDFSFFLSKN